MRLETTRNRFSEHFFAVRGIRKQIHLEDAERAGTPISLSVTVILSKREHQVRINKDATLISVI